MSEETEQTEAPSELEQLQQELQEWKELAQRKAAEVENIRRRAALEKEQLVSYASEHLITKMLPVIDDLHAAVESAKTNTDFEGLRAGIDMIYTKAVKIFEDAGVRVIEGGEGEPFNVDVHEALMHMPSDHPEGHVVQVIQRGYQIHDKVIRHAKVITSAGGTE